MAELQDPSGAERRGSIDMDALRKFLASGNINSAVGPDLIFSPGRELFHYTDLNGLLGILQNGDLWLTHSQYSNDDEEVAHGYRIAQVAITDALKTAATDQKRTEYLQKLKELIDKQSNEGVYICCFCRKDNLLSQWRGYGANGAGVSVQFDSNGFSDWTGADCKHGLMRFWQVFYKAETQRKIVDEAINFTFSSYPTLSPPQLADRAADAIQFFIPTFKNADFSEEAEWRLIFTPDPQCAVKPRFRVRGSMLVPYYRLRELEAATTASAAATPSTPTGPSTAATPSTPTAPSTAATPSQLPIGHITVGPNANKTLNLASVQLLLKSYGYTNVNAEASKTSFRG